MRGDSDWNWLINCVVAFVSICVALGLIWAYFVFINPLFNPEPAVVVIPASKTVAKVVEIEKKFYARPYDLYAVTYSYPQDGLEYLKKLSKASGFVKGATKSYPCKAYFQVICKDENNKEVFMSRFPAKPINSDFYIDYWGRMRSGFSCDEYYFTEAQAIQPCLKEEFYGRDGRYFFRVILEGSDGFETKGKWEYLGKTKNNRHIN